MPEVSQTFAAVAVIQGLLLGMLLGAMGQGVRAIIGLKKAGEDAQAKGTTMKDEFDPSQFLVSLLIGAIAGGLAAMPLLSQMGSIGYQTCLGLMAAGYAGADFIEGFMSKSLPGLGTPPPPPVTTPLALPAPNLDLVAKALAAPVPLATSPVHSVVASSFADPDDVDAFKACKAKGGSDNYCFGLGDNGIGFMGDDCTGPTPMCALPFEDWMEKWGSPENARLKPVVVTANGKTVTCLMGDTMPKRAKIKNGAGIDLSPAAVAAVGLKPPIMAPATWRWADDGASPQNSDSSKVA